MADNLTTQSATLATVPAASPIATDDVAGVHFQKMKLADGTADSSAMIPGDATNGLDVDVTRLPALVASTANIGDVDVLTVPAPLSTTGGGTEATALRVTVASDSTGVLSVDDNGGSLTVDGSVTVSGTVDTELPAAAALADNTANPTVPAVGAFLMAFDGTNWDRVQTGAATGGAVKVDGSAVTQPVSAASLPLPSGAATAALQTQPGVDIGDVTVNNAAGASAVNVQDGGNSLTVDNAALSVVGGGTEATALRVTVANDSTGVLSVDDNGGALTVDNGGTFATQVDGAALTALQLIDDPVFADDAAFTVGTSKVMVGGGVAVAHGANPDAADANDAAALLLNRHRIPFMLGGHPNIKSAVYLTTAAQTDDNVLAAISAGTKYGITGLTITLDEATTVGTAVRLGFGTASVPALPASGADAVDDILIYHPGMVPGSILTVGDRTGLLGVGGDGAELRITCEAPTSGTLVVTVTYFTIES